MKRCIPACSRLHRSWQRRLAVQSPPAGRSPTAAAPLLRGGASAEPSWRCPHLRLPPSLTVRAVSRMGCCDKCNMLILPSKLSSAVQRGHSKRAQMCACALLAPRILRFMGCSPDPLPVLRSPRPAPVSSTVGRIGSWPGSPARPSRRRPPVDLFGSPCSAANHGVCFLARVLAVGTVRPLLTDKSSVRPQWQHRQTSMVTRPQVES